MTHAKSKVPPASPLQTAYRRALSASVLAHARYLAAEGEKSVTRRLIIERKNAWQSMEARKARIRARLINADSEALRISSQTEQ